MNEYILNRWDTANKVTVLQSAAFHTQIQGHRNSCFHPHQTT